MEAPSLTARARALYEDTVVPVREIARICGVTERTILKYARKGDWKPRYHWVAGQGGEAGVRHRRWQPTEKFAPVKGAGARFIVREDAGKPFAVGLKAHDPAGAVRAAADCARAQTLAQEAEARAARERAGEAEIEAIAAVGAAIAQINAWHREQDKAAERARRAAEAAARSRPALPNHEWGRGASHLVPPAQRTARAPDRAPSRGEVAIENALWVALEMAFWRWQGCLNSSERSVLQ